LQQQSKITQIAKFTLLTETPVRSIEDYDADDDTNQFCKQQHNQSEQNPNYTVTL
jgi:hypothetical protein